jgi:hypothetical protein
MLYFIKEFDKIDIFFNANYPSRDYLALDVKQ